MSGPQNPDQTRPDLLIDEVRAIRAEISAAHGNNIDALCEHLREIERQHADRVVRPPAQKSSRRPIAG